MDGGDNCGGVESLEVWVGFAEVGIAVDDVTREEVVVVFESSSSKNKYGICYKRSWKPRTGLFQISGLFTNSVTG